MTTTTRSRPRRRQRHIVASCLLALGVGMLAESAAGAAGSDVGPPVRGGDAVIVSAESRSKVATGGGSADSFSLRLPNGAVCPGDTMTDDWRLQSYVIPVADDPGVLSYGDIGPTGTTQYALYQVDTRPFANAFVPPKTNASDPALVGAFPPFSFAVFPPGTLPDGRYLVGVACTYFRHTATFWDAEIVVTNTATDEPAQFTWSVVDAPTSAGPTDSSSRMLVAALSAGAVGLCGMGIYLSRRRSHRPVTFAKEHS